MGNTPIYLFDAEKRQNYRLSKDKWINEDDEVIENLKSHFGEENVKLIEG